MAVLKCKMCGGTLEINASDSIAVCEYCGTMQTLPKLTTDKKANLYDRANHLRRNNDYDKAMGIYEQILSEDSTDAESYWSLVLCKYGIEYVEDPRTHKRIPTCNRTQYNSVYSDENYKSAIEHADDRQREIYEEEAARIDAIQKETLRISRSEEPYDIFICYKETDDQGRRTPDSVLAQDIYYQLTKEGYKVFFSRISLEDKIGTAYEPYIFSALNSSGVMIVVATSRDYVNAVWVRNEWSRYLKLMSADSNKTLIPAYRDMDPYELPEEFSHLQALDMSKIGCMQDLLHGVEKLLAKEKSAAPEALRDHESFAPSSDTLLDRVEIFLMDGEWAKADEYCERVLDIDPRNPRAYLGKLLADYKIRSTDDIALFTDRPVKASAHYKKVLMFADEQMKSRIEKLVDEQEANIKACLDSSGKLPQDYVAHLPKYYVEQLEDELAELREKISRHTNAYLEYVKRFSPEAIDYKIRELEREQFSLGVFRRGKQVELTNRIKELKEEKKSSAGKAAQMQDETHRLVAPLQKRVNEILRQLGRDDEIID